MLRTVLKTTRGCYSGDFGQRSDRLGKAGTTRDLSSIILIRLLFDQRRAELEVDRALDRRALIVADVDRARELDELGVERFGFFFQADVVFDVPQRFVDAFEPGALGG